MQEEVLYSEQIRVKNGVLVFRRFVLWLIEMIIIILFVSIYFPVWWESESFIIFLWCYFLGRIWLAFLLVRYAHVLLTTDELVYTHPKKIFKEAEVLRISRKDIVSMELGASWESLNILYQKDHQNQILHITYREIEEYNTYKVRRMYTILQKKNDSIKQYIEEM